MVLLLLRLRRIHGIPPAIEFGSALINHFRNPCFDTEQEQQQKMGKGSGVVGDTEDGVEIDCR